MSDVTITNNALGKLGQDAITSLSDDTERAKLANRLYADTRDAVLRAFAWNFALKRASLTSTGITPAFEYTYEFTLPSDCLRVIKTNNLFGKWKIENNKLISDQSSVKVLYVSRETDTTKYDSLFIETFASRLASEMAIPITGDLKMSQDMWSLYKNKIGEAKLIDAIEESQYTADIPISATILGNFSSNNINNTQETETETEN